MIDRVGGPPVWQRVPEPGGWVGFIQSGPSRRKHIRHLAKTSLGNKPKTANCPRAFLSSSSKEIEKTQNTKKQRDRVYHSSTLITRKENRACSQTVRHGRKTSTSARLSSESHGGLRSTARGPQKEETCAFYPE